MRDEPGPRDPDRSTRCTCRYFRTIDLIWHDKNLGDHPMKQPDPNCPTCPPTRDSAPIATKRFGKWQIDDPDWWVGPVYPHVRGG